MGSVGKVRSLLPASENLREESWRRGIQVEVKDQTTGVGSSLGALPACSLPASYPILTGRDESVKPQWGALANGVPDLRRPPPRDRDLPRLLNCTAAGGQVARLRLRFRPALAAATPQPLTSRIRRADGGLSSPVWWHPLPPTPSFEQASAPWVPSARTLRARVCSGPRPGLVLKPCPTCGVMTVFSRRP